MPRTDVVRMSSNGTDLDSPNYRLYWVLSIMVAVAFALALAVYPPVLSEVTETPPTWALMLGRFHPIVVHLPIGVLLLLFLIELFCVRGEHRWGHSALFSLFIATVGACKGVVFGILLARSGGYEGPSFFMHQALCAGLAGVLLVALFLRLSAMSSGGRAVMGAYRVVLLSALGLMSLGAHFGANMVHGSKYLTEYAPEPIANAVHGVEKWILSFAPQKKEQPDPAVNATEPAPPPVVAAAAIEPAGKLVFQHLILPVLDSKCNSCHNEDKSKGGLRMDTYELLMLGGDSGDNVVPGKPDDSLSIQRIMLPEDDDEHMPPEGKTQLTPQETALLKWWIQAGASATQTLNTDEVPAELRPTVDEILSKPAA
jgi:uncharacterized membrane protein